MNPTERVLRAPPDPPMEAKRVVARAVSSARTMGIGQLVVGAVTISLHQSIGPVRHFSIFPSVGIIVLGPGILYLVAATLLKRGDGKAAAICYRGSVAHGICLLVILTVCCMGIPPRWAALVGFPAILNLVLAPALIAFIVQSRHAARIAPLVTELRGKGFEPLMPIPYNPDASTSKLK